MRKGADMWQAASLSKPGGNLSIPVDFVRLVDLSSRSTSNLDIGRNLNCFSVL